jgi:signal transduction histidine kinase
MYKELNKATKSKDKLFSIIAHDLRNPFNTLMGFSDLILKNIEKYDKERIKFFVEMINNSSKQTHTLLENLLEWARLQKNNILLNSKYINLHKIIENNIELNQSRAISKDITIINKISVNTNAFADENMISTTIRNLISNAIKFTNKN